MLLSLVTIASPLNCLAWNLKLDESDDIIAARVKLEVAELLINYGADPNAKNNKGETPLHNLIYSVNAFTHVTDDLINIFKVLTIKISQL